MNEEGHKECEMKKNCVTEFTVCKCNDNCNCHSINMKEEEEEDDNIGLLDIFNYLKALFNHEKDEKIVHLIYNKLIKEGYKDLTELINSKEEVILLLYNNHEEGSIETNIPLKYLNILISDIRKKENYNTIELLRLYLFYTISVIYIGFCFMLLPFNSLIISNIGKNITTDTQERIFHVIEFTINPCYALIILFVNFKIPINNHNDININEKKGNILKWIYKNNEFIFDYIQLISVFLELLTSITAALLIYVAQEDFENIAHYLEYSSFLFLTLIDFSILFISISKSKYNIYKSIFSFILLIISLLGIISIIIIKYYGLEFQTHYLEFSIAILLVLGTMLTINIKKSS
jgi:hypothetical protein